MLVREHKGLPWQAKSQLRDMGRTETGAVSEQEVEITDEAGQSLRLRRIVIRLDEPTRDGEMEVVLLTNVRSVRTLRLAWLFLQRWSIEGLFNMLTTTLSCEQKSLGGKGGRIPRRVAGRSNPAAPQRSPRAEL